MRSPDHTLFVSHVTEDRIAANEIVHEIERRGISCWIAPRDVTPGNPFDPEINYAIESCQAMLLIFSDRCNASEYIRREVTVAGEDQKVIIVFRIEDAKPKGGLRIRLSDLHWIDAFASRQHAIDELIRLIDPGREVKAAPAPSSDYSEHVANRSRGGVDAPKENEEADRLYRLLINRGDAAEQYRLGRAYEEGLRGLVRDYRKCVHLYKLAADKGNPAAQFRLALLFRKGRGGLTKSYEESERLYKIVAEHDKFVADKGDTEAQIRLGRLYENHSGGLETSYVKAERLYKLAANKGDAVGQYRLACFYEEHGYHEKNRPLSALRYFRLAADQGNVGAEYALGEIFSHRRFHFWFSEEVEKNDREAAVWYLRAAQNGYADAQLQLGSMYKDGVGVEKSEREAAVWLRKGVEWYRKAAELGDPDAQNWLGWMFAKGRYGVERNEQQAIAWLTKAAEQDDFFAVKLGEMYAKGDGIQEDKREAISWMLPLAEKGDWFARETLRKYAFKEWLAYLVFSWIWKDGIFPKVLLGLAKLFGVILIIIFLVGCIVLWLKR